METSEQVKTFNDFYNKLLKPSPAFDNRGRYEKCSQYWNSIDEAERLGICQLIEAKLRAGDFVNPNPCFAMSDAMQEYEERMAKDQQPKKREPTNYNDGKHTLDSKTQYVTAKWNGRYGLYTAEEAEAFGMEDRKAFRV